MAQAAPAHPQQLHAAATLRRCPRAPAGLVAPRCRCSLLALGHTAGHHTLSFQLLLVPFALLVELFQCLSLHFVLEVTAGEQEAGEQASRQRRQGSRQQQQLSSRVGSQHWACMHGCRPGSKQHQQHEGARLLLRTGRKRVYPPPGDCTPHCCYATPNTWQVWRLAGCWHGWSGRFPSRSLPVRPTMTSHPLQRCSHRPCHHRNSRSPPQTWRHHRPAAGDTRQPPPCCAASPRAGSACSQTCCPHG